MDQGRARGEYLDRLGRVLINPRVPMSAFRAERTYADDGPRLQMTQNGLAVAKPSFQAIRTFDLRIAQIKTPVDAGALSFDFEQSVFRDDRLRPIKLPSQLNTDRLHGWRNTLGYSDRIVEANRKIGTALLE